MQIIISEAIQLKPKNDYKITLPQKVDSDLLFYSISYEELSENKIVTIELIGEGATKIIHISLSKQKQLTTGELNTPNKLSNIFLQVDTIRFYSSEQIDFTFNLYKKQD